jgi:hypothetical protein
MWQSCLFAHVHAMKRYRIVEVCLHAFLVPIFDVGGQLQDLVPFTKGRKDTDFVG